MLVEVPNWCCVDVWKHPYPNAGPSQQLMMSVGLSVGAPKLMTRLPGPQRMNSSRWYTRPMHVLRNIEHHVRCRAPAPTFLVTTPPVTTLFRSWNTITSPWAATVRSRVPPRRVAAAREQGRSRPSRPHGPRSKCRLQSARQNSRCWRPRRRTRRRRSRWLNAPAGEAITWQSAARGRHWVLFARAARAWHLYRRRARRCAGDRA